MPEELLSSTYSSMSKYISTKTYKHLGPVAYRQWRADSHCRFIHGYSLEVHVKFIEKAGLDAVDPQVCVNRARLFDENAFREGVYASLAKIM